MRSGADAARPRLQPIAEELGTTLSKMAIAWCLLNTNVSTVILGAAHVEQLQENLSAAVQARLAAV